MIEIALTETQKLPILMMDFEARSPVNIKDSGAQRYAEDPKTELLMASYNFVGVDKSTSLWVSGEPFPQRIIDHIQAGYPVAAHHVQMELWMWYHHLHKKLDIPMPKKWIDTQASCAYRAIPLSLDGVGEVLRLHHKKDKRGKYLINKLCKPRKPRKAERKFFTEVLGLSEDQWPILYYEDSEDMKDFQEYCIDDTDSEVEVLNRIGHIPKPEYNLWVLDQRINNRGVKVDIEAVKSALFLVEKMVEELQSELIELTDGYVQTGKQVAKICEWLTDQGFPTNTVNKDAVKNLLNEAKNKHGDKHAVVKVLKIRQQLSMSSVSKLQKFLISVCRDDRCRGLLQYHGASTGRWAGRGVQPQNFPRGSLEKFCEQYNLLKDPGRMMHMLLDTIKTRDLNLLRIMFGDVMEALATALRGMFIADFGKKLMVADFSAIEAVVTAWLAGEEWKVKAFEGIQRGEGYNGSPDIYCATASGIFGYSVTDKKKQVMERGVGKICELAFGYQGALGAWRNFDKSDKYNDEEVLNFCRAWRDKHPQIRNLWYGLERAAKEAVLNPGKRCHYRSVAYEIVEDSAGQWLTCILPNGRRLWYFNPMVGEDDNERITLYYEGKNNKLGGCWDVISSYGGMLTENVVQAISRDIMVEAMFRVEKAGYPVILTVHDEIVSEVDENFGSIEEFQELMAMKSSWLKGCPIATDAWSDTRYRK